MIIYLLKGILAGMIMSPPSGPIGVLCIKRSLLKRKWSGFFTGVGATIADMTYAVLAVFGVGLVYSFVINNKVYFQLLAGVVITGIGLYDWTKEKIKVNVNDIGPKGNYLKDFVSGFLIAFLNPATVIFFFAAYSLILHQSHFGDVYASSTILFGSFIGCLFVWTILSLISVSLKHKIRTKHLDKITKVSSIILILSGLGLLISLIL